MTAFLLAPWRAFVWAMTDEDAPPIATFAATILMIACGIVWGLHAWMFIMAYGWWTLLLSVAPLLAWITVLWGLRE